MHSHALLYFLFPVQTVLSICVRKLNNCSSCTEITRNKIILVTGVQDISRLEPSTLGVLRRSSGLLPPLYDVAELYNLSLQ